MPKLVNLGSLCIDHVYRVNHLAGAGETVASSGHQTFAGGKGLNQSLAAARAGAQVAHLGCIGTDGALLLAVLEEAGVETGGIRMAADVASGHAVIQVNDAGENAIVIAGGANLRLSAADLERAMARLDPGDWLLLQNEINDVSRALSLARTRGARIAFNVAPADERVAGYDLTGVELLIVNGLEARALVSAEIAERNDEQVAGHLAGRYPEATVILTVGADGLYHAQGDRVGYLPAFPVQARDETGAGDAFIGYLIAALLDGRALIDALRQGAAAGALAVTREGAATAIPTADSVGTLLAGSPVSLGATAR